MNRDTPTDILDQPIRSANASTCSKGMPELMPTSRLIPPMTPLAGQLRQPQDLHRETTMRAPAPEKNRGVNTTPYSDISYLTPRISQEGLGRDSEIQISGSRSAPSTRNPRPLPPNGDRRRNLYVLGLPFDLTKSEFSKIFEPYGTVSHAVILATLDSASRRRGFIVMSTHQEAKIAMDSLSRTQIKGHMLDVSWAVVQRSQGFLDGADRTMMLAISTTPSISEPDTPYSMPGGTEDQISHHWELTHLPTSKLLVTNLSTMLFTQVSDLHPLFNPFGPIKDIKIVGSSSVGPMDTTITAIVEYVNVSSAQEAKDALQFQSYVGHPIEAHYVCDAVTPTHTRPSPFLSGSLVGHGKSSDIGLNPFAIPFNIGTRICTTAQVYNPRYGPRAVPGLPGDAPISPQAFPAHVRPFISDAISRSSSATSSSWSHDGRPLRPSRTSHSFLGRANTAYASYA